MLFSFFKYIVAKDPQLLQMCGEMVEKFFIREKDFLKKNVYLHPQNLARWK